MRNIFLSIFLFTISFSAHAQVIDGLWTIDSTIIRFNSDTLSNYVHDTATAPLWQLGRTHKPFFTTDTGGIVAMMTDTINHYPVNANNWFTLKIPNVYNMIIDFWHKYQTDSGHDGGVVEYSLDSGATWQNIKGDCNSDSTGIWLMPGTKTTNFYTFADTLSGGEPAFSGTSGSQQYSRFQFLGPIPLKTTSGITCHFDQWSYPLIYVRFRFISDTVADTLAGWIIDSIKIEHDYYPGGVTKQTTGPGLHIAPNPSTDGHFILPAMQDEDQLSLEVYNSIGIRLFNQPYSHYLNLGKHPRGLYYYKVSDGKNFYCGTLLYE